MDGRKAAATLGVDLRATRDEIRRAFRARAKRVHPDIGRVGSDDDFIALRAAFDHLVARAPECAIGPNRSPVSSGVWDSIRMPTQPAVDLTDVRRPVPSAGRSPASVGRDRRGLTFDDHLAAALAAQG